MLKFELKKIWKQKKLYWIIAIVLLVTSGIFIQNTVEQKNMEERALEQFEPFIEETQHMGEELRLKQLHDELSVQEEKQYEHIKAISTAFFHWKRSIHEGLWEEIPAYEKDFLTHVEQLEAHGGTYSPLQGIEREKRIAKNEWLVEHSLGYEDESYPTSPHLILTENAELFFGLFGIVILLLFFGDFITAEKEQNTWFTLNTQPIPKWQLFIGKHVSSLFLLLVFLVLVIVIGIFIPFIFGDFSLKLSYPQIVIAGERFELISTFVYVSRAIMMFFCAIAIIFSIVLFSSKWFKNTFTVLMITGFILIVGFVLTELNVVVQSVWNPFQALRMDTIIETIPRSTDLLYLVSAFLWSTFFIYCAIYFPDKEVKFFKNSDTNRPFGKGKIHHWKMVLSSILFESRKIKRRGILSQVSVFTLLIIVMGFTLVYQEKLQKEQAYIDQLYEIAEQTEKTTIPELKRDLEKYQEIDKDDYSLSAKHTRETLEFVKKDKGLINKALKGYDINDWIPLLEYQLHRNKLFNGDYESDTGNLRGSLWTSVSSLSLEASIQEKNLLIKRNIQPIFSGEFINTIFHNWNSQWGDMHDFGREWEEENQKLDSSGLYALYYYFNIIVYIIPLILLLFLFGGSLAEERGKSDTIRFLQTQPISKRSLFTGKLTYSLGASIVTSFGFILFVILIGTIFDRFGDWYYPILHYDSKSVVVAANYTGNRPFRMDVGFHFIPLGEVLLKNISLFLCMLISILTIAHVFSLWFKNKLTVLASTIIFTIAGYVMSANLLENKAHLSPFTYFDISRITNGEIATILDNPAVNVQYGVVVMVISFVVILSIGYLTLLFQEK